jgi:hypothetical protein
MNELDQRIRDAVRGSLAAYEVPSHPQFVPESKSLHHGQSTRWVVAVAATVCLAVVAAASTGHIAVAQLENTVTQILRFFEIDARGRQYPLETQSLSLTEALQTQAFHVIAPAGLPDGTALRSIQRLGSGNATMLIFTFDRGGRQLSIIETPSSSQTMPTIGYSRYSLAPDFSHPNDRGPQPHGYFKFQATEWVAGSAHVALFAERAMTSDEVTGVERAMSHP